MSVIAEAKRIRLGESNMDYRGSDKRQGEEYPTRQSEHTWRGSPSKSMLDAEISKEYCAPATQPTAHPGTCCPFVGPISLPWSLDAMLHALHDTCTP